MYPPTRRTLPMFASAVLSLLLHMLFLGFADQMTFATVVPGAPDPGRNRPPLRVVLRPIREAVFDRPRAELNAKQVTKEVGESVRNREVKIKELFEKENLITAPAPQLRLVGPGSNVLMPKPNVLPARESSAPRPSILEIDAKALPEARLAYSRPLTPKLEREEVAGRALPSLVAGGGMADGMGATHDVRMRLGLPAIPPLKLGDLPPGLAADNSFEEEGKRTGFGPVASLPGLPGLGRSGGDRSEQIETLDALLSVAMVVYETRDGGYFRIDISPNPRSERLPSVPKDVLFLIDCSNSISEPKLEHFKNGALASLDYLNKLDRLNVVSFRDTPKALFADYAAVTPETLQRIRAFIGGFMRDGMTDVYAGLAPFVGSDRDASRPLSIFLLSDGQSTVRNRLDNETMIRQVVAINRANVSVHTFSAGRSANLFLLDLLAYNNRGFSIHREELPEFNTEIASFISRHADMIVADLDYHVTGDLNEGIYPKRLPHLYRGETLSIYGRYPTGTAEVAVSIVGRDGVGRLQEMLYRGNIRAAPRATPQLAADWASQKVYHLISLNALRPNPEYQTEARRLAESYRLYVPYW